MKYKLTARVIKGFEVIRVGLTADHPYKIAKQARNEAIGGHTDWAVPDTQTLRALGTIHPENIFCWSCEKSEPSVNRPSHPLVVEMDTGIVIGSYRDTPRYVRLVRISQIREILNAGTNAYIKRLHVFHDLNDCANPGADAA